MRIAITALTISVLVLAGCNRAPSKDWSFKEPEVDAIDSTRIPLTEGAPKMPAVVERPQATGKPLSTPSSSTSSHFVQSAAPEMTTLLSGTIATDSHVGGSIGTEILHNLDSLSD